LRPASSRRTECPTTRSKRGDSPRTKLRKSMEPPQTKNCRPSARSKVQVPNPLNKGPLQTPGAFWRFGIGQRLQPNSLGQAQPSRGDVAKAPSCNQCRFPGQPFCDYALGARSARMEPTGRQRRSAPHFSPTLVTRTLRLSLRSLFGTMFER
jgi:hypothetical protein